MMPKELMIGLRIAGLILIAYVAFCIFLFVVQRRLIYLPSRAAVPLPPNFEPWFAPGSKEIWGYKRVSGAAECLFFFHGNGGNASGWSHAVAAFPGDIFVLEYPGYGERPGRPTEESIKAAAREAFAADEKHYQKVVVAGQSLGAAVTEAIFSRWPDRVHRLVLITPFISLSDMARSQFSFVPAGWILRDKMELFAPWTNFPGKTTLIIAGADEIIPHGQRTRFLNATNARVSAVEIHGAAHNTVDLDVDFWRQALK